jgi:MFS family permease
MGKSGSAQGQEHVPSQESSESAQPVPHSGLLTPDTGRRALSSSAPPLFTRDFTLLCLVTLGYFFSFFFFFPTLPFYVKHLGGQEADAGFLIGISSLVSFSIKPLAGRWIDRYGRVRLMNLGIGLFAFTAFLHAWAPNLSVLFVLRVLYGTALGCFTSASSAYLADVAPLARRGEAASYWGLASPLAMGIIPPFALGLMHSTSLHPTELSLSASLPGFFTPVSSDENFILLFLTASAIAVVAGALSYGMHERFTPSLTTPRPPLFAREAVLPMAVNMFLYLTFTSYTTFLPLYARTLGMSNAGWLYSTYALVLLGSRFTSAQVSDRYGRTAVILPGLLAALVGLLILGFAPNASTLYLGVSFYGLGFGLAQPGLSAYTIDRLTPERRGVGMSTFSQGLELGMGLGGILMGYIATHAGFTTMYLCGSVCVATALAIFVLGNRRTVSAPR